MSLTTQNPLLSSADALELIDTVIQQADADGVFVSLTATESALTRFSENQISQNVAKTTLKLTITSYFGQRRASAATTELDTDAITETLQRSAELARFAPDDPEWTPLLPPQDYPDYTVGFDEETANIAPLTRGERIEKVCSLSRKAGVEGSGKLSTDVNLVAIGNSLGLRICDRTTEANFHFTSRIEDGSAWGSDTAIAVGDLPLTETTETVIARSQNARQPRTISPGVYPVIFSPAAIATFVEWLCWGNFDARAADEGRTFMSQAEGEGNRLGEQLFSPLVTLARSPDHPLLQTRRFFWDGLPNTPLTVAQNGIPETLAYSRYWAQKTGKQPTGSLSPLVMTGSDASLADLIAQTERGILVNRAWYVRDVNPRTCEVTGMTRDGTFWIENGKVVYPIKNLRFNQTIPDLLRDIEAVSQVKRCGDVVVPGTKVKAFNFSSITDSI
ncbi:MAG: TldD/PmbA family protein [Jaaginema sp. PMC 1079.18]|nr:TldD/PmbA family protein [Jaaginema sp. PMC 1080.18]MEC4849761.1 TldD/PmbA family protein [Jaaginema sp. PMC 1079.18]MEC4866625.1 TldD/PmbA family protein [Jaaginema sp. PMC 1078.18]